MRTLPPVSLAVLPDGDFGEWQGLEPAWRDPSGDGAPGGLDLGSLYVADDGETLFLALEVGREVILQNDLDEPAGSDLTLRLSSGEGATSSPGAEIRLGRRQVLLTPPAPHGKSPTPGAFGLQTLPTHSGERFEIRVPLPDGNGNSVRFAFQDGPEDSDGDRLPDRGFLTYHPSGRTLAPPQAIPLDRPDTPSPTLRILSLNLNRRLGDARSDPADEASHRRILQALRPDVVAFQELYEWSADQAVAWVTEVLGPPADDQDGGEWHGAKSGDCVTVSRFPIAASAPVDNNLVTHLDLPKALSARELVLFNAHPPCCDDEAGRDREMDHLAATWRDLLAGTGPFRIDPQAPAVFLGDFNLVGFRRQLEALREGRFVDPRNGPAFHPGRGRGSLATVLLRHSHARHAYTWRDDTSSYAPGRLDWILYTGDSVQPVRSYILDTGSLPPEVLERWRLEPEDSERASDHLALVVDLRFPG